MDNATKGKIAKETIQCGCDGIRQDLELAISVAAIESILVSRMITTPNEIKFLKEDISKQPPFCDLLKRLEDLERW